MHQGKTISNCQVGFFNEHCIGSCHAGIRDINDE